jgi:hypothetical protein
VTLALQTTIDRLADANQLSVDMVELLQCPLPTRSLRSGGRGGGARHQGDV